VTQPLAGLFESGRRQRAQPGSATTPEHRLHRAGTSSKSSAPYIQIQRRITEGGGPGRNRGSFVVHQMTGLRPLIPIPERPSMPQAIPGFAPNPARHGQCEY
jgi:hypothetical protein